ncbi:cupin domain-containing protein [Clostridium aminobutyricum]|uniref:DUF861 domain-containing protein n=1 Tax=Clostridium aminobutyricum TaxID=33953 RepID=A0A939IKB9_CLOAM|nr:cupin domain-containing protein [Clostridium aminobutyricum]MBN7774449.1 DUF861 domain-containing protein [Clostridium aminobutyricum]
MKKLICAKEIEEFAKQGKKVFYMDSDTIITPAAQDAAQASGVEFSTQTDCCKVKSSEPMKTGDGEISSEMIYSVLKALADQGQLSGVLENISCGPYIAEKDKCGLKIVRGNSVKYEVLDTGNPKDKVFYQEIINADDGCSMNAGFITIETCNFDWECACQELYYVVEGTLTVAAEDKTYTAYAGDAVFFPKGAKVTFGSPNKMKAFYATY